MAAPPPVPYPMLLDPRYVEKPWGGRRLADVFGRALPGAAPVGESWELFDRPAGATRIRNGPLAGRSLAELRGRREIPLILKILDIRGRISVQVHPDGEAAAAHGTEEKSEAWVVLEAGPDARIARGLREAVDPEAFREAVAADRVEELLHVFTPKAGDVIPVPAGTIHSVSGGVLLAEIQQNSETTYRLWDGPPGAGPPRELHLEQGLASALLGPAGPDRVVPRELEDDGNLRRLLLLATDWCEAEHLTFAGTATFEVPESDGRGWHAILVLQGEGTIRAFDRRAPAADFRPGDALLLPAGHDHYEWEPRGGKVVQALAFREP
jgi:mannose-6-phosphate isomerase